MSEVKAERLDQYVVRQRPELSRAFAEKLIERGQISVNGRAELKSGYRVKKDDTVAINYSEVKLAAPDIEIPVIYEDRSCVVVNKQAGMLSHSKGVFNPEATVATWLKSRVTGLQGERAGIVHRLDRLTSGVMICAKTPEALSWLQKQFSLRKVKKTYIALVKGSFTHPEAVIDMPIERNPKRPQTFRVGSNGKPALTAYKVLQSTSNLTLLALQPTTGRTHQLRVHLSHLGHPILGDVLYGGAPANRLYLHAQSLEITLPSRQRRQFEAPLPPEFNEVLG